MQCLYMIYYLATITVTPRRTQKHKYERENKKISAHKTYNLKIRLKMQDSRAQQWSSQYVHA